MSVEPIIMELNESRTDFYRMLYKMYNKALSQEDLDALDAESFKQMAAEPCDELMAAGFNDMYRFLRRRNTGTRQVLSADFTRAFMGTTTHEGFSAQPYASLFIGTDGRLMGKPRQEVNRVYRRYGIKLSDGIDLPEDHLAFMCEFLAILNERTNACLELDDYAGAIELLTAQRDFIEQQILTWLTRFYSLGIKISQTRFYHGLLKVTKSFFDDEPQTLSELIEDLYALQKEGAETA